MVINILRTPAALLLPRTAAPAPAATCTAPALLHLRVLFAMAFYARAVFLFGTRGVVCCFCLVVVLNQCSATLAPASMVCLPPACLPACCCLAAPALPYHAYTTTYRTHTAAPLVVRVT
jgi:hypothetical protein